MILIFPHATPAEIEMASGTIHMWASSIFLYSYIASGAFPYIFSAKVGPKPNSLIISTDIIPVPRLLTFKTSTSLAFQADYLSLFAYSCNCLIAFWVHAPKHVWSCVNLSGKSIPLKLNVLVIAQVFLNIVFRYRIKVITETFDICCSETELVDDAVSDTDWTSNAIGVRITTDV